MKKQGGQLKPLNEYFKKYQKTLVAPEASVIDCFVEVVKDVLHFEISNKKVMYNPTTKTIQLQVQSALKSEIKMHEKELLNHVKGRLGTKSTPQTIL